MEQKAGGMLAFLAAIVLIGIILWIAFSRAHGAECSLTWDPPPPAQQVTSWKIYRGIELLQTVTSNSATLDLPDNQTSTLAVVAVNSVGSSLPATITVTPAIPMDSSDLADWQIRKAFFFEEKNGRHFFRFHLPTKNITIP